MGTLLLTIHILLGIVTVLTALFSLKNSGGPGRDTVMLRRLINWFSLAIVSGFGLAIQSTQITALSLCKNIALYGVFIGAVGVFVYLRSKELNVRQLLLPLGSFTASLALLGIGIIYGV